MQVFIVQEPWMVTMRVSEQKQVQSTECDDRAAGGGQLKFYIFTFKKKKVEP